MSTIEFQKALVRLIKAPEHSNPTLLAKTLSEYDLNKEETDQLTSLSNSIYFKNFTNNQIKKRFDRNITRVFPIGISMVGQNNVFDLYSKYFEPELLKTPDYLKPEKFLQFLKENHDLVKKYNFTEFFEDIFNYEYSEFLISNDYFNNNWSVSENSLLNPNKPFIIKKFRYPVVDFLEENKELEIKSKFDASITPQKRECTILFLRNSLDEEDQEIEQFEIDHDITDFLNGQLKTTPEIINEFPAFYEDLLDANLVKVKD